MPNELIELLRDSGLVSATSFTEIEEDAANQNTSIVLALGSRQGVRSDQMAMLVAQHYSAPFARLVPGRVAMDAVQRLTLSKWRQMRAIPVEQKGDVLTVAAADPALVAASEELLKRDGTRIELVVSPLEEIDEELRRIQASAPSATPGAETPDLPTDTIDRFERLLAGEDTPAFLQEVLRVAVELMASDVHIFFENDRLNVRYRKDGSLRALEPLCTIEAALRVIAALKITAGLDITEKRRPQDGRARVELDAGPRAISVLTRVATFPCRQGEKIAIRVLESGARMLSLHQVGLTRTNLNRVKEALRFPNGLFLVTGPTGSGKTTSLYAALKYLANEEVSVFTIEDPIEFDFPGAYQSQINEAGDIGFAMLLKALLRQDPNIILLGEIRDDDSAQTALHAALSGRLVLSTLHANSACTALTRLIDMGVEPFVLGTCTRAIIGQRLVRKLCPCKRPVYRMPEKLVRIKEDLHIGGSSLFEPVGCPSCFYTGYHGRIAVHELLTLDRDLSDMVVNRATSTQILESARSRGFETMGHDGFTKVLAGLTTVAEVERQVGPAPGLEAD